MHDRDILKIKASKSNDSNDWSLFKKQRNIVNSESKPIIKIVLTSMRAILKRPGRLSMNLLRENLGKNRRHLGK